MSTRVASQLEEYFEAETNGHLRSIVKYEQNSHDVLFLRDDVEDAYSTDEVAEAVNDSRFESLSAPIYADLFEDGHGELECFVKSFSNVIEMNFVISDGTGVVVALDADAMAGSHGLIVTARNIVVEERNSAT